MYANGQVINMTAEKSAEIVLYERIGQVGRLTVNRPEALNAINSAVLCALDKLVDRLAADLPRCLVVTGSGEKAFAAGADIREMNELTPAEAEAFAMNAHKVFRKLELLPIPLIAAVNGYALGGGCELALCCDLRIASERVVFSLPETGLGIMPGFGASQRLPRVIGVGRAKKMIFTGCRVGAEEALSIGLVSAVYPAGELMNRAMELAEMIAAKAPIGIRMAKSAIDEGLELNLSQGLSLEAKQFSKCFGTEDQRNGLSSYLKKSSPEPYEGR